MKNKVEIIVERFNVNHTDREQYIFPGSELKYIVEQLYTDQLKMGINQGLIQSVSINLSCANLYEFPDFYLPQHLCVRMDD